MEVNEVIREGKVFFKFKMFELVLRVVVVLYVFNYIMIEFFVGVLVFFLWIEILRFIF